MSQRRIVLLGPQRLAPTLNQAVGELEARGEIDPHARIAAVTAGWEEREAEDQELSDHLGGRVVNLAVYHRVEEIFQRDPELLAGMHARHDRTRKLQELYRLRLAHALDAARALVAMRDDDTELLEPECAAAIEAVRQLDAHHQARVAELHARFEAEFRLHERPAVAHQRAGLRRILAGSSALCLAGGHVAILLNRMRVLDVIGASGAQPIFAWSAGAMALSERVVLFHDSPPQGAGNAEVLEPGLGVARGVVPLPHARRRLRLSDPNRVTLLARRFGPALCAVLDERARLDQEGDGWRGGPGTLKLTAQGEVLEVSEDMEARAS